MQSWEFLPGLIPKAKKKLVACKHRNKPMTKDREAGCWKASFGGIVCFWVYSALHPGCSPCGFGLKAQMPEFLFLFFGTILAM
ncbi:MAG: hypothetical protein HC913_20085 [Microscillaceae bacterium]|nr:hypothetical protein [Microscillaceae bacterium]